MFKDNAQARLGSSGVTARRTWQAALVALITLTIGISAVVFQADEESPSVSGSPVNSQTTATTTSPQAEVTSRLREILRTRDKALLGRNPSLLSAIYTVDCSCLTDGRALIAQLRDAKIVWKGVRTTITIRSAEKVNDRLWIIVATVRTPSVRIETETGRLVRIVPAERNVVRFALARPRNEEEWLLGHASNLH
jgi:hypothetical protein